MKKVVSLPVRSLKLIKSMQVIELAEGIRGVLRASEISAEKVEDARTKFNVGDSVEAKVMGTDRKVPRDYTFH